jgi:hypothetical protein
MENPTDEEKKMIRAVKRVEEIKGFYKHLVLYLIVNLFLMFITNYFDVTIRIFEELEVSSNISDSWFAQYPVWFIWGFFLAVEAIKVFLLPSFLNKNWQEKKIEEYMNNKSTEE